MKSSSLILLFFFVCVIEGGVFSLIEKKIEEYLNGDIYNGELEDNRKHGVGKYTWFDTQNSFDGFWKHDQMHGDGIFKYSDGAIYDGEWLDNERSGLGFYKSATGNTYIGNWLHGLCHGHGQLITAEETYEGEWKMGAKYGRGEMTYADGSKYSGDFENNLPNGQGVYTLANGDVYTGGVVDGKRQGQGSYHWVDAQQIYNGLWEDGEMTIGKVTDDKKPPPKIPTATPSIKTDGTNIASGQDKIAKATQAAEAARLKKKRNWF